MSAETDWFSHETKESKAYWDYIYKIRPHWVMWPIQTGALIGATASRDIVNALYMVKLSSYT
jgi:hypothetical protein